MTFFNNEGETPVAEGASDEAPATEETPTEGSEEAPATPEGGESPAEGD